MKKRRSNQQQAKDSIAKIAKDLAQRLRVHEQLLTALANAVAANEKVQRRFWNVVLVKLARIEATVQMIHGAQIVEAHCKNPAHAEKMRETASQSEAFIAQRSHENGLKAIEYIYDERDVASVGRKTRRKGTS
jgi:hypothetical protein